MPFDPERNRTAQTRMIKRALAKLPERVEQIRLLSGLAPFRR
jgi:hypothetical protein